MPPPFTLAGGEVRPSGTIVLNGSWRPYQVQVKDGYAGETEGYQAG
jgi:hypothetical protein